MRVLDIVEGTSVYGPGLRTAIYFAGCLHQCPGCHNKQSWDMAGGREMTVAEIVEAVERAGFSGVTFSGGDPLYQIDELTRLACALKEQGYDLWCYTGFLWESLVSDDRYSLLLNTVDVLVDGPFVQSLRDTGLLFRGSSNQRLILSSLSSGNDLQLYEPDIAPAFLLPCASGRY